jgi:putative FmdB family regulatory protein
MSVYEYKCLACKKTFAINEPITTHRESRVRCPRCGKKDVERHWGAVNVVTSKKS